MKRSWDEKGSELVRCVVRGSGRIVARAATLGNGRRPLAWVLDEFFVAIAQELEAQGVSRRVAADLFGVTRRTFVRNLRRAEAGADAEARTLWSAILETLRKTPLSREGLLSEYPHRPVDVIRSILHDLTESGLVEEHEGRLVAGHDAEALSDERLRTFIAVLWGTGSLIPAAELATLLGAKEERVEKMLDDFFDRKKPVRVDQAEDLRSLQMLLTQTAHHVLASIYDELDGRPTASMIFEVDVFESARDVLDLLRSTADRSGEEFSSRFTEICDENAPADSAEPPIARFSAFFSHRAE